MKSFIRFSSFLLSGAFLMLFPVVIVTATFTGPSTSPPSSEAVIQVDPTIPPSSWPVLNINSTGAITIGVWETTDTGLSIGTGTPPAVAVPIGTLYGGTGCSGSTPGDVRTCLGAAASGANSDIISLSPAGTPPVHLSLNPSGFVGIGVGGATPTATLSVGNVGGVIPFLVNSVGDIIKINNVTYSWPASAGVAGTVLTNSGPLGTLTWSPPVAGSPSANGWTEDTVLGKIFTTVATRNVGIGTTTATLTPKLTVKPTSAGTVLALQNTAGTNKFTVDDTGTVTAGSVPWARLTAFPTTTNPCPAGQFVSAINTTITCSSPGAATGGWTEDIPGDKVYLITPSRNVGIGTSLPAAKLHVAAGGGLGAIIEGSVGVGTTTPSEKLTVVGIIESINPSGGFKFPDGTVQTTAATGISGSGIANNIAKWIGATTLGNSSVYEDPAGNLGIGAGTGPFAGRLHVGGNVLVQSGLSTLTPAAGSVAAVFASYSTGAWVGTPPGNGVITAITAATGGSASSTAALYGYVNSSGPAGIIIDQGGSGDIARFQQSGSTVAVIDNTGDLGIGTGSSTVGAKIEVVNNTDDTVRLTKTAGTAGSVNFYTAIPSSSMTGDAACASSAVVTGALTSGKCLGQWNSSGTNIACNAAGGISARVLCTGFGN